MGNANSGASAKAKVTFEDDSEDDSKDDDSMLGSSGGACAIARAQVRIKTGMTTKERIIC